MRNKVEQERRIKLWTDRLESGIIEQAREKLKDGDCMCCLGIACQIYMEETGEGKWVDDEFVIDKGGSEIELASDVLPLTVMHWFGIHDTAGAFYTNPKNINSGKVETLADLNDKGISFKEIAAVVKSKPTLLFEDDNA